jgi:phosphoglycerol transferase MdoB-like AlkP superfamily enzyme
MAVSERQVQTVSTSGGTGLGGLLFVAFLVLKLTDVIDWSWWWVTAPLWAPAALVLTIFALGALFVALVDARWNRRGR